MVEDTQFWGYSADHLSGSFEASPQHEPVNALVPYRPCPPTTFPNFNFLPLDMSTGPVITIRPEDAIGSNTVAPPELAVLPNLHHTTIRLRATHNLCFSNCSVYYTIYCSKKILSCTPAFENRIPRINEFCRYCRQVIGFTWRD